MERDERWRLIGAFAKAQAMMGVKWVLDEKIKFCPKVCLTKVDIRILRQLIQTLRRKYHADSAKQAKV